MTNTTAAKWKDAVRGLETLRVNPDWAKLPLFDRSKWQRVRFGDVVENPTKLATFHRSSDPNLIARSWLSFGTTHETYK
jgi:hypothetical protein